MEARIAGSRSAAKQDSTYEASDRQNAARESQ
jgi:hypothetical protein